MISESIHKQRGDLSEAPPAGVRQPGVGAESHEIQPVSIVEDDDNLNFNLDEAAMSSKCHSRSTSVSRPSDVNESDLEALRMKVKSLAVRPIEGGDGKQDEQANWETELNATVDKLDHLLLMREKRQNILPEPLSLPQSPSSVEQKTIKQLQKIDPLPLSVVSLSTLSATAATQSASMFNSKTFKGETISCDNLLHKKKRKLSLE